MTFSRPSDSIADKKSTLLSSFGRASRLVKKKLSDEGGFTIISDFSKINYSPRSHIAGNLSMLVHGFDFLKWKQSQ